MSQMLLPISSCTDEGTVTDALLNEKGAAFQTPTFGVVLGRLYTATIWVSMASFVLLLTCLSLQFVAS